MLNNKKAKETSDKISEIILSYLEADPNKDAYISAIEAKHRDINNGYSNIQFTYCSLLNNIEKKNIRIENYLFGDKLFISATKASKLKNADLLIFYDLRLNSLYIADKDLNNNNSWLDNKSLRNIETFGKRTFFTFSLESLLNQHAVFQIFIDDKLRIIHDNFISYWNGQVIKSSHDTKALYKYPLLQNKIKFIQNDLKDRDTIYYCFHNQQQADKPATILGLVEYLKDYTDLNERSIYQRLYNAAKANKYAKIPLKQNSKIDPKFIKTGDIAEIGLSLFQDQFLTRKVNITDNKQSYKQSIGGLNNKIRAKVNNWLKRHNDDFNPNWTDEEIDIAKDIISKR